MKLKIKGKLILWFLVAGVLPLIIVDFVSLSITTSMIKNREKTRLVNIAREKIKTIKEFERRTLHEVEHIAILPDVARAVNECEAAIAAGIKSKTYRDTADRYVPVFVNFIEVHPCYDMMLTCPLKTGPIYGVNV